VVDLRHPQDGTGTPSENNLESGPEGTGSYPMRRRLPRQGAGWPAKYTIEGVPRGAWGACEVIDISILGAGLLLFGAAPPDIIGRQILVEVQTPSGASITLQMVGEARNCSPGSRGGTRVGIEFGHLSDTERAILNVLEHMRVVW
jgi:PilZ domain